MVRERRTGIENVKKIIWAHSEPPSKKYEASFVGQNGDRFNAPFTFLPKSDANAWLSSEEVKHRRGIPRLGRAEIDNAKPSPIFETFVERHLGLQTNSSGPLLWASTQTLYKSLLRVNLRVL
jgi:hypothetical protein